MAENHFVLVGATIWATAPHHRHSVCRDLEKLAGGCAAVGVLLAALLDNRVDVQCVVNASDHKSRDVAMVNAGQNGVTQPIREIAALRLEAQERPPVGIKADRGYLSNWL